MRHRIPTDFAEGCMTGVMVTLVIAAVFFFLTACVQGDGSVLPTLGNVHHCSFFDGVTTTTDDECLTPDTAEARVLTYQRECEAMHVAGWYCDAECKAGAFDWCVVEGGP